MHVPNRERLDIASSKTALDSVTPCTPGLGPRHAPKRQQLLWAPFLQDRGDSGEVGPGASKLRSALVNVREENASYAQ